MLMDIFIYVSLIRLRYVFNNVVYRIYIPQCYTNGVGIFGKKHSFDVFLLSPLVILRRNKKTKKITSTTKI